MKTSHISVLAAVLLSLTLCACDSGDKSSGPISTPEVKTPKPPKVETDETKVNPTPPESTEPAKNMNAAAVPGAPTGEETPDFEKFSQVDMINNALTLYAQKRVQAATTSRQMAAAGRVNKKDANGNYIDPSKPESGSGAAGAVTSLDQLVKAGIIKSIPEPPAGKKYVLDVKAQKVKLENK